MIRYLLLLLIMVKLNIFEGWLAGIWVFGVIEHMCVLLVKAVSIGKDD